MIQNRQARIARAGLASAAELPEVISEAVGRNALRWYLAEASKDTLLIECTTWDGLGSFDKPSQSKFYPGKTAVLNIIPTGVGLKNGLPVIAVKENTTVLNVTGQTMGISNLIEVNSYLEAAGAVMALKKGISLESLTRPLRTFR